MTKLLVMTEERREELRKAGAYAEEVFYAMTEVELGDMDFECGWGMKKCSAYLLKHIKEAQ